MKALKWTFGVTGVLLCWTALVAWAGTAKAPEKKKGAYPVVTMETTKGTVEMELYPEDAPKTVENFVKLVKGKFYDGIVFHRVEKIPEPFVVQAGDPATREKPLSDPNLGKELVPAEIKRKHVRGAVAMARTPDAVNPERKSSGSQFYICLRDTPHLDGGYTAFGQVIKGMEVVDKIERGDKIKKMTVKTP